MDRPPLLRPDIATVRLDDEVLLLDASAHRLVRLDAAAAAALDAAADAEGHAEASDVVSALQDLGLTAEPSRRAVLDAAGLAALGIGVLALPAAAAASTVVESGPVTYSDGTASETFLASANSSVGALTVQSDGKIVIGGRFSSVSDGTTTETRRGIARFHANGMVDTTFADPNIGFAQPVNALGIDSAGRILVGGQFSFVGGQNRGKLARVLSNGALDTDFADPNLNNAVNGLILQGDLPVAVGSFATAGASGTARAGAARFLANGALDTTFSDPQLAGGYFVPSGITTTYGSAIIADGDGRLIVSGLFGQVQGVPRRNIARLSADGVLDTSFVGPADPDGGYAIDGPVRAVALEATGNVVAGGNFTVVMGDNVGNLLRLAPNGALDSGFLPNVRGGSVEALIVQGDGEILVGGYFTSVGGVTRNRIARLTATGTLDADFDPNANNNIVAMALDAGDLIVGGAFTNIGGADRTRIARLG